MHASLTALAEFQENELWPHGGTDDEDDDEDGNEDTGFISAFQLNAVCPGGIVATAFT